MDTSLLYSKLSALPENLKKEVADFIEFLLMKSKQGKPDSKNSSPKFGSGKGMFTMHKDFDEPLEDFKDYMPE